MAADPNTDPLKPARIADAEIQRGPGGETHQTAGGDAPALLTTQQGMPVADDQNSLASARAARRCSRTSTSARRSSTSTTSASPSGSSTPAASARTASSRTTSRSPTSPAPTCSSAPGEKTPAFVRFSTVAGNKGSADLARDVRGFAVKFYTQEGNWDLVGNNIPVFFIQDAIKFPDLIHAAKQEPDRGFPQAQTAHDNFWDFVSLTPESMHMIMWIMSDRAIPRSFRFMEGFGVHTFRLVNADGQVDLRQVPLEAEARHAVGGLERGGEDQRRRSRLPSPRPLGRDPGRATSRSGSSGLQLFDEEFADKFDFDVLDADQDHPGGARAGAPRRAAGARPRGRQLLRRDRAGRVLHPEHRARHRLHQRPAAAGPQLLLPRHAAEAAGQPELHAHADQRAEVPVRAFPAGRPHGDASTRAAAPTTSRTRWGAEAGPARRCPSAASSSFPARRAGAKRRLRAESFADHYSQARQFFLSQTPSRAEAHRRRASSSS